MSEFHYIFVVLYNVKTTYRGVGGMDGSVGATGSVGGVRGGKNPGYDNPWSAMTPTQWRIPH